MINSFYEYEADKNDYFWMWQFTKNYTQPHFHKSLEVIYCVQGSMTVFIDKQHYILQKDDICFIPSYIVHSNKFIDNDNIIHSFVFAHNFFHDFEKTFPQKTLPYLLLNRTENQSVYNDLSEIFAICEAHNYSGDAIPFMQRQLLINALLLKLSNIYPLVPVTQAKEQHSVIEILTFINQNYKENLSLSLIAEQFHYSPKYFSFFFKKNVGCNLTEYVNTIRMKNIFLQMENPANKKSITTLAFENGFNSLATFYRALKQYKK